MRLPMTLALAGVLLACGTGPSGPEPIAREAFIDTYVDLRMGAEGPSREGFEGADRQAVFERHGVSKEDMTDFVEFWGTDVKFMHALWTDIRMRLDTVPQV